jgi:MFS transporter, SP family, solute carrier family 2 (myo-inositol transporter), member 13
MTKTGPTGYSRFLLFIAGLGGLLYGVDVGIIAAALLYLNHTIELSLAQTSLVVAAVLGGGMVSSLVAGILADWVGRRRMMLASGAMFVASIVVIVLSHGFGTLFTGRLLQGMSGGVIGVVAPLYLAESLGAENRGRGTAIFQFMLTFGILAAAFVGWHYTRQAETAITAAAGNAARILAAQNHAWRSMFLVVIYPGILFFAGTFALSETPRWLLRRGRVDAARAALRRTVSAEQTERVLEEMQALDQENRARALGAGSLLQRKYVLPFVLACVVLVCTQTTGINSILQFLVLILRQAGMSARLATQGDVTVKLINCLATVAAVMLVDRRGRRFLLRLGTGGVVLALLACGFFFLHIEQGRRDVRSQVDAARNGNRIVLPLHTLPAGPAGRAMALTVTYSYGHGTQVETVLSDSPVPVLTIVPAADEVGAALTIRRAVYGPVPSTEAGWIVAGCLGLFILFYAVGPGVVVWLMLSELMPTRIRSSGMGVAMLLNQGASTLIAAVFLPVVGFFGYYAMFFAWAGCTVVYFITASFFLPETRGRTLEEIEMYFEKAGEHART